MGDPVSMGLQAAGSIVKGISAYKSGIANKRLLYGQAREDEIAGNTQALMVRDQARQAIGNQVAAQFANGFMGGTGSALQSLSESQVNATLDMLNVQREAASKGIADRWKGDREQEQGQMALLSGVLQAGTDVYKGYSDWTAAKAGQTPPQGG